MALYAIGDLHLSLRSNKPMEIFGDGWRDYVARIREGFSVLTEDDVTVLCGDLSWGMSLEESLEDFRFIDALPGKKYLLKGSCSISPGVCRMTPFSAVRRECPWFP